MQRIQVNSEEKRGDKRRESIFRILPEQIRGKLKREQLDYEKLQEIRMRVGNPLFLKYNGKERHLREGNPYLVTKRDLNETIQYAGNYSLYAFEQEMGQGYLTVEGGHRVGVAGQVILEGDVIKNLKDISSIHIRVAHEVYGCSEKILPILIQNGRLCNTLIIAPPGCGKTTLLRDLIRQISDGCEWMSGRNVGVVDERSEIGGMYMGIPQNHIGIRTDLLDSCPKAKGMMMLIRSMGPEVIAIDEVGSAEEVQAVQYAMYCGCNMLATVHGISLEDVKNKPVFQQFFQNSLFQRYVVLTARSSLGEIEGVYDGQGGMIC